MRISVVGGVERMEPRLQSVARSAGHELEFHAGHTSGTSTARLKSMIERSDLVLIVTEVNSHSAVLSARDIATRSGRPLQILRRLGTSQLKALLH